MQEETESEGVRLVREGRAARLAVARSHIDGSRSRDQASNGGGGRSSWADRGMNASSPGGQFDSEVHANGSGGSGFGSTTPRRWSRVGRGLGLGSSAAGAVASRGGSARMGPESYAGESTEAGRAAEAEASAH